MIRIKDGGAGKIWITAFAAMTEGFKVVSVIQFNLFHGFGVRILNCFFDFLYAFIFYCLLRVVVFLKLLPSSDQCG